MMLVEKMWTVLDQTFDQFKNLENITGSATLDNLKGQLRMGCEMTALFMAPHYTTTEEVAREVMHRWKMKQAGETYETPGLASRRYDLPDNKPRSTVAPKMPLSEEEQRAVRIGVQAGFTHQQMASTYGVTVAVIAQVVA